MFNSARLLVGLLALASAPAQAGSITTVHAFASGDDGAHPTGGMILAKGQLYGTTTFGGADNLGTIFQFDPSTGDLTVLHAFEGSDDGAYPNAAPIFHKGVLYGATFGSNSQGFGTVYALNLKSGALTSLHVFTGGDDGGNPDSTLSVAGKVLYGTAASGAETGCGNDDGCGTVFQIDLATGKFATLYAFPNNETEGSNPAGGLLLKNGSLFGTGFIGGIVGGELAAGTLFALDPATGVLANMHTFSGTDGNGPRGNMLYLKGTLYGATTGGGLGCTGGCGTLFSYDIASASFAVLHAFTGTDGRDPKGGLIFKKGKIYGTTLGGGTGCANECGTIFSINPVTGVLTNLYNFTGGADGEQPWGGLVYDQGIFYGTTELGADGYGTVFALKP